MEKILINTRLLKGLQEMLPGKKENREALKNIYSCNGSLFASNGHTALRVSKEEISGNIEGNAVYKIISSSKSNSVFSEVIIEKQEIEYPPITKLFEEIKIIEAEAFNISLEDSLSITSAIITIFEKTKNCYNYEILEKFSVIDTSWKVYPQGKDKVIYIKSSLGEGLVLPFKRR